MTHVHRCPCFVLHLSVTVHMRRNERIFEGNKTTPANDPVVKPLSETALTRSQ